MAITTADTIALQLQQVRSSIPKLFERPMMVFESIFDTGLYVLASPKRKHFFTGWLGEDSMRNAIVFFSESAARAKQAKLPRRYKKWDIVQIGERTMRFDGKTPVQMIDISTRAARIPLQITQPGRSATAKARTKTHSIPAPRRKHKQSPSRPRRRK